MAEEDESIEDLPETTKKGGGSSWMPVIVVIILLPVLSFVMAEFVFIPRLQKAIGGDHGDGHADKEHSELPPIVSGGPGAPVGTDSGGGGHGGHGGGSSAHGGVQMYHFDTVKTNLANPSTTLIIVKFSVKGSDPNFMNTIGQYQVPLTDASLKVLSLLTRIDTQSPGIQNVVKNDLITRFNQVLGRELVEDLYFVDFVTQ
jgi:flagellar basal body-associated protein FliL